MNKVFKNHLQTIICVLITFVLEFYLISDGIHVEVKITIKSTQIAANLKAVYAITN